MSSFIRWTRWMTVAIALVLLLGSFGVTSAASRPVGAATGDTRNAELERNYQLRKQQLRSVEEMLRRNERRAGEISQLIERAKREGKNTTAAAKALVDYRAKLVTAQASWKAAADVLKAHAGFSDAGKVTNADQAAVTVRTATTNLEASYLTLRSAEEALNKALAAQR